MLEQEYKGIDIRLLRDEDNRDAESTCTKLARDVFGD